MAIVATRHFDGQNFGRSAVRHVLDNEAIAISKRTESHATNLCSGELQKKIVIQGVLSFSRLLKNRLKSELPL